MSTTSTTTVLDNFFLQYFPASLLHRGIVVSSLAVLLTVLLELTCLDEVRKLCSTQAGKDLYRSALISNIRNNLVLGPLTYYIAMTFFSKPEPIPLIEQLVALSGIVVIEAFLYFLIHKAFHEVKGLYWMHSYHHKFNTVVLPSSANAVSVAEYSIAYMLPLVLGVALTQADEVSALLGAAVVGVSNLLIHTPWLEETTMHWIFVSAGDHLTHHRKVRGDYGAPVFHVDRILDRCASFNRKKALS